MGVTDKGGLNPRAVGKSGKVTNGYAGVVDVPAAPGGAQPTTPPIPAPAGKKNLTDSNLGIAIGRVRGGHTFSFSLMPPGGASLPVAVVLGPAQLTVTATLSYAGGTVTSQPITVALRP